MVVGPIIMDILKSKEVQTMLDEYEKRFGERFPSFNFVDFHTVSGKPSIENWKEMLRDALRDNKPCRIESKLPEFEQWLGR